MAGFLLRHKNLYPHQYLSGTIDDPISQWVTHDRAKATVFPTIDEAIEGRRAMDTFAELFEIIPVLEILR